MKKLTRRTAIAGSTALAATTALFVTPVLATIINKEKINQPIYFQPTDDPLDVTQEVSYWDQIADGIERKWREGKMPKCFDRLRARDGLADFADALEDMWRSDKMPEALETMRIQHVAEQITHRAAASSIRCGAS